MPTRVIEQVPEGGTVPVLDARQREAMKVILQSLIAYLSGTSGEAETEELKEANLELLRDVYARLHDARLAGEIVEYPQ